MYPKKLQSFPVQTKCVFSYAGQLPPTPLISGLPEPATTLLPTELRRFSVNALIKGFKLMIATIFSGLFREYVTLSIFPTIPFRGGPITSDVVMSDANAVKMHEVANVILSGPDTLGISFKEMTEECRTALENADVIITKGQANFYVLSEFGMEFPNATIISLFVTKCDLVSDIFGLKGKVGIAAILKEKKGKKQL
jgi:hypothetical protein